MYDCVCKLILPAKQNAKLFIKCVFSFCLVVGRAIFCLWKIENEMQSHVAVSVFGKNGVELILALLSRPYS